LLLKIIGRVPAFTLLKTEIRVVLQSL
jgi:hypothetical protein